MFPQVLGWCIIVLAACAGLVATCCKNCRSRVSYLQLTFWKRYMETERAKFEEYAAEYAGKLAERNLKSFFQNSNPEVFPFPNHRSWEEISTVYTFSKGEQCYSTLQHYVERSDRDYSPERRPVLDLEYGMEMA